MTKKSCSCLKVILITLSLLVGLVIFLELGTSWYIKYGPEYESSPYVWLVCDLDHYPRDQKKIKAIEELVQKHIQGLTITRDDLEGAIVLAPQADMPNINGVVCNDMIIVSARLSRLPRLYVSRHELEHVFQMAGLEPDCEDTELCANWAAAREYPLGFLFTITSSLREAYRISPSFWDFLFSSWYIFKVYMLPF